MDGHRQWYAGPVKVVRLKPGCAPELVDIASGLERMQQEVGGYIEILPTAIDGVVVVCNEEGTLRNLATNAAGLRGTVIFCSDDDDGELVGLDDETAAACVKAIEQGRDLRQN